MKTPSGRPMLSPAKDAPLLYPISSLRIFNFYTNSRNINYLLVFSSENLDLLLLYDNFFNLLIAFY